MAAHAPLISALKPGVLSYSQKGNIEKLAISTGFVEVSRDLVSVLTDFAESADEIDQAKAKADRDEAEKELSSSSAPVDETETIRERLDHASARLSVLSSR